MKKIISIVTATRAEYGLLKPLIAKLKMVKEFDIRIVVTGMHLSSKFGFTYKEIEEDGNIIDRKIEILLDSDSPKDISKTMARALIGFSDYFEEIKPDLIIALGDRYETLAVCCAAMNANIPIAHLYGGETTEGAIDESMRHAITKMSYLHFTSTKEYRKRVIQLGESPERVFEVGALGIENIVNTKLLTKSELEQSIGLKLDKPYAVVTFHPVTLEENNVSRQFDKLLEVCNSHQEMNYIFTKANADANGSIINKMLDEYTISHDNVLVVTSLGMVRYLSALKYCCMVVGNSSSGLIEAPSFGIPTINIGDRQKGRLQSESVINCEPQKEAIEQAFQKALDVEFCNEIKNVINPYGDGNTSNKIVDTIKEFLVKDKINLKKQFFNIEFQSN